MPTATQTPAKTDGSEIFANAAVMQERGSTSLAKMGEIMSRTATAVWQKQSDFYQHEASAAAKGFEPFGAQKNPGVAGTAALDAVRDGFERAIANNRAISDLLRDSASQMLTLYASLWQWNTKPTKP